MASPRTSSPPPDSSVFSINGGQGASPILGTCFFVHEDREVWYFVTCQHLVNALETQAIPLRVGSANATVTASGKEDNFDLAVLSVIKAGADQTMAARMRKVQALPLSGQIPAQGTPLHVIGHTRKSPTHIVVGSTLQADVLGVNTVVDGGTTTPAFTFCAPKISPGFSGGPVMLRNRREAVGVAVLKEGKSDALALSLETLRLIWPGMPRDLLSAPRPTRPPAPALLNPGAQTMQGFIVAGDIADFSRLPANRQLEAWRKLLLVLDSVLDSHPFVKTHSAYVRNLNADSFTVTFPAAAQAAHEDTHGGLVGFAERCIKEMAKGSKAQRYPIRIALHEGEYQEIRLGELDAKYAIGTAVNDCVRLLGVSDIAGNIVTSEKFASSWADKVGAQIYRRFVPAEQESPVQVFLKRDHPQGVRAYVGGKRGGTTPPERLWLPSVLDDHLRNHTQEFAEEFFAMLYEIAEEKRIELAAPLSLRASLFVPRQRDARRTLCSTKHRHIVQHGHGGDGSTSYSLEGGGAGPAGRAFHTNKIQILHGLPDYAEHPLEYLAALKAWDLDAATVEGFSRHSRAFIDIPFGITRGDPVGVLCIDTLEPLDQFETKTLHEAADDISSEYKLLFATLWLLRTQ